MPSYNALVPPPGLYPGDVVTLVAAADAPTSGFKSQQVCVASLPFRSGTRVRFEGAFVLKTTGAPSDPGTFKVELQQAANDSDIAYTTCGTATVDDATNFNFAIDQVDASIGPFFRVKATTITNSSTVTMIGTLRAQ